jgi:plastocyanin
MRRPLLSALLLSLAASTCAAPIPPAEVVVTATPPAKEAIGALLDDWHDAAARADEERYFRHLAEDAVFLGTDATERWSTAAFRAYAHPRFAAHRAWSFKPVRREITLDPGGTTAWFDEDLDTPNLGPARGSGVLGQRGGEWKILQYNLAVTVPNERFEAVKRAAAGVAPPPPPCPSPAAIIYGTVSLTGKPPLMKVPRKRKDAELCKTKPVPHNAVVARDGRLADVLVRIENGSVKGHFAAPSPAVVVHRQDCTYAPRLSGAMVGQTLVFANDDPTLHNLHVYRGTETWFNRAHIKGGDPIPVDLDQTAILKAVCDVHPWERGFVVVSDHPFFSVTRGDGAFQLDGVPPGKHRLEAWHSIYGLKKAEIEIAPGARVEVDFSYTGTEPEPAENQGELHEL